MGLSSTKAIGLWPLTRLPLGFTQGRTSGDHSFDHQTEKVLSTFGKQVRLGHAPVAVKCEVLL